ncbi:probable plastid-lipid-associated protein 2, chloroplastic [Amborella trichopoda]|uniref:Plastid lipid-associated protein/fibrillin conserved domain-containing protein n=1 Tax=Amborella trichopoda TaxID=13333 RepID=W1PTP4_AMBTC|nr:probable plastid-lipid-associated protein 2, chloroplastic [Amborella trichopoda]ERN10655.1 hypothetical protein AMTR_s00028p00216930 [Amborella trichopoda]|eukprot:XP_006849074.1 probable plastid-lipid-associated protein 2, chloroplastic [Amborella trichopoda]
MAGISLNPAFSARTPQASAISTPIPRLHTLPNAISLRLSTGSHTGNRISSIWKSRRGIGAPRVGQIEPEEEKWGEGSGGTAVAEKAEQVTTEVQKLKKELVEAFYGTERGLKASSETRAEIVELITQLEALNPTPAPTEALPLLNGKWILAYTTFSEMFPLFAMGTLPLVKVQEISQTIDSENFTVENTVLFSGPLATTSFTTNAKFAVRSPKRVQIKFEEGVIGTPKLTDSIEIPDYAVVMGQTIDLSPFRGIINTIQDAAASVARSISGRPPFKFPITTDRAESWLLTTFLDEDLRISRGDASSVFVLIKEGSSLLPQTP